MFHILVQGQDLFSPLDKENAWPTGPQVKPSGSNMLGPLFSSVSDCHITIAPRNFVVEVGPATHASTDLKYLLDGVDMDEFTSQDF